MTQTLTVKEAAAQANVSQSLIYALLKQGRIEALKIGIGRGSWRIEKPVLDAFIESCRKKGGLSLG